jgi:CzcA family heavy metal efflux pump
MTLGGLAIAIGELVDDAIVDIENIFRRLRENYASDNPKNPMRVIYEASLEVRSSIVYATFIVILVFLPLFMLQGIEGRLLTPLGFAYIIALAASLVVSLTITPVLASYLLPRYFQKKRGTLADAEQIKQESFLVAWLKKIDEKLLHWTLQNPRKVIAGSVMLFMVTVSTVPFLGSSFLPEFNEGTVTVNILANPGISLSESDRIGRIAEKLILEVPEVVSTGRRTGRAELDEHAEGVHYTEIDVDLKKSERSREDILGDIRKALAVIPGVSVNIGQPISHRLDHMQSGVRAQIAIKLFGSELSVLRAKADEIKNILMTVEGATDIQVEKQVLIPQIRFIVDRVQAANYGLTPGEIAKTLETGLNGLKVSEVIDGNRRTDIVLRFDERFRSQPENLKDILIHTPMGSQIPISAVAKIEMLPGPNQILRENGQRRIVISANTSGRDLGSVVQEIQQKIAARVRLPEGYFLEIGGQFEAQQKATRILSLLSIVSLFAIFALLVKGLGHWQAALQVMINVPLALIGAIWALHLSGGVFSVATLVGFVSLAGITTRNGIMMIAHYLYLMREEGEEFSEKMIIRGSLERLVPVMMTALTACLSLVPFAVAADAPGKEILHPLAVVVIGGILTATLLDQIVTPAVFYKFGRKVAEQVIAKR